MTPGSIMMKLLSMKATQQTVPLILPLLSYSPPTPGPLLTPLLSLLSSYHSRPNRHTRVPTSHDCPAIARQDSHRVPLLHSHCHRRSHSPRYALMRLRGQVVPACEPYLFNQLLR